MSGLFSGGLFGSQTGGGGGGTPSPLTTKGDLYTHNGSSDQRLPVGSDGFLLTPDAAQPNGIKWIDPANLPIPALTDIPTDYDDNATVQTAASTTFVTVATKTLTIIQSTKIHGVFVGNFDATTAAALASIRVQINAVNGRAIQIALQNTTDKYSGMAQHFSATLTPGTYTINAQMNRVSGTGTVNYRSGALYVQAQQANLAANAPSRIFYVSKNGGGTGADGSWSKPYSTISAAVTAAQLTSDFNAPFGICLMPGVGTTQYSDTAPVVITKGGMSIFTFAGPDFKAVNVHYSGSFHVNPTAGSSIFFGLFGFEINCPSGAAWNSQPAALYCEGTVAYRVFGSGMVFNANSTTRGAIYCNNASVNGRFFNSEIKAGNTTGPNINPLNLVAGNITLINCDVADRQSANVGTAISVTAGTLTLFSNTISGKINKLSNTSVIIAQDNIITSGVNACITMQATSGGAGTGLLWYSGQTNSTAANVITGGENCQIGVMSHVNTGNGLDPLLNGGAGPSFYITDTMPRYVTASSSYWDTSSPTTMKEALDRLAKQVSSNGASPIPL